MARSLPTPPDRRQSDVILRFCNFTIDKTLAVVWVDYDGKEIEYATLEPGDSYGQATYITHPWRIKDGNKVLLEYVGDSATLLIDEHGNSQCLNHAIGTAPVLSSAASYLLPVVPPKGIPHPTDPLTYGAFRQRGQCARGIPVCAFDSVSNTAVETAELTLTHMLADVDQSIIHRMLHLGVAIGIIGENQNTTDIPAHCHLKGERSCDGRDYDVGTRGLGGSIACPWTTVGEENITMIEDSRYPYESILVHEFAHSVMNIGLAGTPTGQRIKSAYDAAIDKKLYNRTSYIASNEDEYWAEATQAWFEATVRQDATSGMTTREAIKKRDPVLADILTEVWGDGSWRYLNSAPGEFKRLRRGSGGNNGGAGDRGDRAVSLQVSIGTTIIARSSTLNMKISARMNAGKLQRNSNNLSCPRTGAIFSKERSSRAIRVITSSSNQGDGQSEPAWYEDSGNGGIIGGNGGKGDGGDNDWGEIPEDGGSSGGYGGSIIALLVAAAAAAGAFTLYQKRKKGGILDGLPLPDEYDSDDVRTLKRLLREVFSDLVKVRGRLDELETATGISSSDVIADATPLEATSTKAGNNSSASPAARDGSSSASPRLSSALSGALKIGGGLLWEQEPSASTSQAATRGGGGSGVSALDTVQDAGVRLGTDLILRVGGPVRGGKDAVMAEVRIDPGEEQFALQKILYSCRVFPGLRAILAPFGARGQDVAYTLNPLAGQGLTSSVKHGNPLHQKVLGSVLAAAADLKKAWLSVAYFSSTGDDGEIQDTVMAQAVVSPIPAISLGLTILEPGQNLLRSGNSTSSASSDTSSSLGGGAAAPLQQQQRLIGGTLALSAGELALHGWTAAEADSIETKAWHDIQWGMSVGPRQDGSGNGWSLGIGKVAAAGAGAQSDDPLEALQPNLMEISTQWNMGDGLLLTPGVVVLRKGGQNTVFAGVKTAWLF